MLETVTGQFINVADPDPATFNLVDIGWALSRQPRFGGHSHTKIVYSVAQHCVFTADLVEQELSTSIHAGSPFAALTVKVARFHDASEAYLIDLPSPVKNLPGIAGPYKEAEARLMDLILRKFVPEFFDLDELSRAQVWRIVKAADLLALAIEAYHFMPSRGKGEFWNVPTPTLVQLQQFPTPLPALEAFELFMREVEGH